jgi:hypothetical protein
MVEAGEIKGQTAKCFAAPRPLSTGETERKSLHLGPGELDCLGSFFSFRSHKASRALLPRGEFKQRAAFETELLSLSGC